MMTHLAEGLEMHGFRHLVPRTEARSRDRGEPE